MGQLHLPAHTRASFTDLDSTGEFRMVEFVKIQRKNCFREKCLREGFQSQFLHVDLSVVASSPKSHT